MEVVSGDNWSCKMCKAPVGPSQPTPHYFTGRMPFLSPNQQCLSTEGKISHSMDSCTVIMLRKQSCGSSKLLTANVPLVSCYRMLVAFISGIIVIVTVEIFCYVFI